jgi:hypothetical protein
MDYVTRQFINLAKKLRDDLRKGLSVLHHDLEHGIKVIDNQLKRDDKADQVQAPSPILRAELQIPEAIKTQSKAESDRNHRLQKWMTVGTWFAFLATATYAYFTIRQWRELISARHQTQHAIEAANRSADAAEKQNILANRAWIQQEIGSIQDLGIYQKTVSAPFTCKNIGKGPAGSVVALVVLQYRKRDQLPTFDYTPGHPVNVWQMGILFSNPDSTPLPYRVTPIDRGPHSPDHVTTKQEAYDFRFGLQYLVVHGRIEYRDLLSNRPHWLTFCELKTSGVTELPKKTLETCSGWNQIDTN